MSRRGSPRRSGSPGVTLLGLFTHESSVMFLPVLVALDWALAARAPRPATSSFWLTRARAFVPHLLLVCGYLLIDLRINSRN